MAAKTSAVDEVESYINRKALRLSPAWMPQKGSTIKGEVIRMHMRTDGDYEDYPVITYRVLYSNNDAASVGDIISVHAFHTMIRERLADLKTNIGVVQWVSYEGTKASKKRKDANDNPVNYHVYDIENDGQDIDVTLGKAEDFKF